MFRSTTIRLFVVVLAIAPASISLAGIGVKFSAGGVRFSTPTFRGGPRIEYQVQPRRTCPPPRRQPPKQVCPTPAPAPVQPAPTTTPIDTREQQLRSLMNEAKVAFQSKKYRNAIEASDKLLKLAPKNTDALQLRALSYFAMGEYQLAARSVYTSILNGPIWTRAALKELYEDASGHSKDLSWLRAAAQEQPDSLHVHFLLAYHNLVLGNLKAGEKQLQAVLAIKANEPVASRLLQVVQSKLAKDSSFAVSR